MRLPTIRELAELARKRGAKGIVDRDAPESAAPPEKIYYVHTREAGEKTDQFFYDSSGYREPHLAGFRPSLYLGQSSADGYLISDHDFVTLDQEGKTHISGALQYWSSSESMQWSEESDPERHSFYVLDATGRIHDHYPSVIAVALCVKEKLP